MSICQKNWKPQHNIINGKCKKYMIPGCWNGYDTFQKGAGKCGCVKRRYSYVRRTGTSYNSISNTGPLGHPKANGFGSILFEKNIPAYMWLDQATRRSKGNKYCKNRCKGQQRLKYPMPRTTSTPGNQTSSRSVAPPFQSYETVLAVRKAKAYFDPSNYKRHKKWRHANCRY